MDIENVENANTTDWREKIIRRTQLLDKIEWVLLQICKQKITWLNIPHGHKF